MLLPRDGLARTSIMLFFLTAALALAYNGIAARRRFAPSAAMPGYCTHAATAHAAPATVRALVSQLRVMNYFPARGAATYMWSRWDPATVNADFGRIADLHANTVRLFVFATFGYPHPSSTMLDRLANAIALAHVHGLRVQLTLFGFWSDYRDITGSEEWAHAVLAPYRNDPRIAFVEVQNELDLTHPDALSWARTMSSCVRDIVGNIPITLSVSGALGMPGFRQLVAAHVPLDLYDLHYYGPAPAAYHTFQQALKLAGPIPLFIGETGYSTRRIAWPANIPGTPRWWEEGQDQYYRTVEYATRVLGLPPAAPWIMSDFLQGALPPNMSARDPVEYGYGLYHTNGTAKPAVTSIKDVYSGAAIDTSFNNSFESADGPSPGLPADWLVWQPSAATFVRDTNVAHSGTASARISHSVPDTFGEPSFYVMPIIFLVPGKTYRARVWTRGTNATGSTHLSLAWFDVSGKYYSTDSSSDLPTGTTDWTQLQVTARAPANAVSVQIHLVSANNSGSTWFDDVSFEQVHAP